jgi:ssDNA-binding Zn-finger/Zn-ribbon topoisomerase 1
MYPEHKESRPLPGDEPPAQAGTGETCPKCGLGTLVGKRGRFGPFVGCDRYPDCDYIQREGPQPPDQLPFEVVCPKNQDGRLVPRRARRTGNVFWGCSNYPKCDYTTNFEPVGAFHDLEDGPVGRKGDAGICLVCGAEIPLPEGDLVARRLTGGPPNPEALARPGRGGRRNGRAAGGTGGRTASRGGKTSPRRARRAAATPADSAPADSAPADSAPPEPTPAEPTPPEA